MVFEEITRDLNKYVLWPDTKGLLLALDSYQQQHPDMYQGKQSLIENAISTLVHENPAFTDRDVFSTYAAACCAAQIRPLKDMAIAFVGARNQLINDIAPIRNSIGRFLDLEEQRGRPVRMDTVPNYIGKGKIDLLVTGNVLNDPRIKSPEEIMFAGAHLVRQGGITVHVVGRTGNNLDLITSEDILEGCGQTMTGKITRTAQPEKPDGINPIYAVVCKQDKELTLGKPGTLVDQPVASLKRALSSPDPTTLQL